MIEADTLAGIEATAAYRPALNVRGVSAMRMEKGKASYGLAKSSNPLREVGNADRVVGKINKMQKRDWLLIADKLLSTMRIGKIVAGITGSPRPIPSVTVFPMRIVWNAERHRTPQANANAMMTPAPKIPMTAQ